MNTTKSYNLTSYCRKNDTLILDMTQNTFYKYNLGYTTGALMFEHFDAVINESNDFSLLVSGNENIDYHIIPVNAESSQKRYLSEIKKRLKNIPISVLDFYMTSDDTSKKVIQFYAICRYYKIVLEFMIEVIRNKWLHLDFELERYDYKNFLQEKLLESNQAGYVTAKTLNKLTQVFFKMLIELGMYSGKTFNKINVDDSLMRTIAKSGDNWFLDVMLLSDDEKKEIYE